MSTAFSISTLMPRTRIFESCLISDITGVSTGLVGEDSLEPLLFLWDSESVYGMVIFWHKYFCNDVSCVTCAGSADIYTTEPVKPFSIKGTYSSYNIINTMHCIVLLLTFIFRKKEVRSHLKIRWWWHRYWHRYWRPLPIISLGSWRDAQQVHDWYPGYTSWSHKALSKGECI